MNYSKALLLKKDSYVSNAIYQIPVEQKDAISTEQVVAYRQEHALPMLDKLKAHLEKHINKVPKDSLTYKAMSYTLNQWEKLTVYCTNGELRISNIMAENAIRPFVVGRKAWLFADDFSIYSKELPRAKHIVGKRFTQWIERTNLTLRSRLKRLVRKTIGSSKSIEIHDKAIGTFIEREFYW